MGSPGPNTMISSPSCCTTSLNKAIHLLGRTACSTHHPHKGSRGHTGPLAVAHQPQPGHPKHPSALYSNSTASSHYPQCAQWLQSRPKARAPDNGIYCFAAAIRPHGLIFLQKGQRPLRRQHPTRPGRTHGRHHDNTAQTLRRLRCTARLQCTPTFGGPLKKDPTIEIGRASCRERGERAVHAASLNEKEEK